MVDVIEATFDVAFQDPFSAVAMSKCREALLGGVCGGAFWSEALGIEIGMSFRDGEQSQQV